MNLKIFHGLFLVTGLLFGYGAYYLSEETYRLINTGVEVKAKVIDLVQSSSGKNSSAYYPVFEYEYKDKAYRIKSSTGTYPPPFEVGDVTALMLDPQNPKDFVSTDFLSRWGGGIGLGFFCLVFSAIGSFGIVSLIRLQKKKTWLKQYGITVTAKVISVDLNRKLKVNGRSPWQVKAQWQDPHSNVVHLFESDNLWDEPTGFIGDSIEVRIDRNNPKVHDMLVTKTPKVA